MSLLSLPHLNPIGPYGQIIPALIPGRLPALDIPLFSRLVIFTGFTAQPPTAATRISLNCIASGHLAAYMHHETQESATRAASAT